MRIRRLCLILSTSAMVLMLANIRHTAAQQVETTKPSPADQQERVQSDELTAEAQQAVASLRATLPADSEARMMLEDILQGCQLGPTDGWFRVAVSQTRYDWSVVSAHYDRNANGKIERDEFAGPDNDFRRLDRDRNSVVTSEDLNWPDHALVRSPGALLFGMADRDSNGKVTPKEFSLLFQQLDSDSAGYLSLDDLRDNIREPAATPPDDDPDQPSRSTLIVGLANQELGSLQPGPVVGDMAPDFTLTSLDGTPVTLSAQIGEKPIVLIFGNFTCWPFRSHSGNLEKLYQRYRERAKFFLVYVREAHPSDGWWSLSNQRKGIDFVQPTTDQQRCSVAEECRQHLKLDVPFLVDTIADTVGATYSGMPNRLYLIDTDGRVAFKSGRGPFGFKPGELEQALIWYLAERQPAAPTAHEEPR